MNNLKKVDAIVVNSGPNFALMRSEGVDAVIFIPVAVVRAVGLETPADLVVNEQRVVTYGEQADGRLRATELGSEKSRLPQPKVVDQARDGSWKIQKLGYQMLYRVVRPGEDDEDFGTLAKARQAVGKVIEPPKAACGKTNDPSISRAMKGPSNGCSKKKAA